MLWLVIIELQAYKNESRVCYQPAIKHSCSFCPSNSYRQPTLLVLRWYLSSRMTCFCSVMVTHQFCKNIKFIYNKFRIATFYNHYTSLQYLFIIMSNWDTNNFLPKALLPPGWYITCTIKSIILFYEPSFNEHKQTFFVWLVYIYLMVRAPLWEWMNRWAAGQKWVGSWAKGVGSWAKGVGSWAKEGWVDGQLGNNRGASGQKEVVNG